MTTQDKRTPTSAADCGVKSCGSIRELSGPDLTAAESISQVLNYLDRRRSDTYPCAFFQELIASGLSVSVRMDRDGSEHLMLGCICDGQEDLRRERLDALVRNLDGRPWRRGSLIRFVNFLGYFIDERCFESIDEAARRFVASGGRIILHADGKCREELRVTRQGELEDSWDGYRVRRVVQRYHATIRARGRAELASVVRRWGRRNHESGTTVLELLPTVPA